MKRLISGLFSSISDAELFAAMMEQEAEDNNHQPAVAEEQPQLSVIAEAYNNTPEKTEE